MSERQVRLEELMPLIRERLACGQTVTFSPKGVSMLPMLRQGKDTVTLYPLPPKLQKYDLPLYQRKNGQYVLHRVVKTGESYTCIGDNQFAYESGLTHEQMIAVVGGFTRGGNYHTTDETGYKLYCRFWHFSRPFRRIGRRICRIPCGILRRLGWKKG